MTVHRFLKGSPQFDNTQSSSDRDFKYIYITLLSQGGPACSQSFNRLSGQRTHQLSGDRIGQSLSLWQIPGTQRSWMKRCRTPREKEMEERHFMCHIWGLQKSVSSKCQELVQGENEISCQRSWEALLWLTFNMTLFRSAAQTQCHSHRCHTGRHPHVEYFTFHQELLHKHSWGQTSARNPAQRYTVMCVFSLCGECMCIRGAWGWEIWIGGRIVGVVWLSSTD